MTGRKWRLWSDQMSLSGLARCTSMSIPADVGVLWSALLIATVVLCRRYVITLPASAPLIEARGLKSSVSFEGNLTLFMQPSHAVDRKLLELEDFLSPLAVSEDGMLMFKGLHLDNSLINDYPQFTGNVENVTLLENGTIWVSYLSVQASEVPGKNLTGIPAADVSAKASPSLMKG